MDGNETYTGARHGFLRIDDVDDTINIDAAEVSSSVESNESIKVSTISREKYDALRYHDPRMIYATNDGHMFMGDIPIIIEPHNPRKLYMGIDMIDGKTYYQVMKQVGLNLVEIERYTNQNDAVDRINRACEFQFQSNNQYSTIVGKDLYKLIDGETDIITFVIMCLGYAGYSNHPNLQVILQDINKLNPCDARDNKTAERVLHDICANYRIRGMISYPAFPCAEKRTNGFIRDFQIFSVLDNIYRVLATSGIFDNAKTVDYNRLWYKLCEVLFAR